VIIAIHQPNLFPWLGYFSKMVAADRFVLLDDAQFPKSGGGWSNRVKIQAGGQATWLTIPVRRPSGVQTIRNVEIQDASRWSTKTARTLQQNYGKHPFFGEVFPLVKDGLNDPSPFLAERNCTWIRAIAQRLDIDTSRLVLESSLPSSGLLGTERLVRLTKELNGTTYLSGDGSDGYLEEDLFQSEDIGLRYMDYKCTPYDQKGADEFIPGLSVIDALFNLGIDGTSQLIWGRQ
tara:strand:- start:636 stop:1337 length:702 start_codon:yes stop_codon:yes gene_type:complete